MLTTSNGAAQIRLGLELAEKAENRAGEHGQPQIGVHSLQSGPESLGLQA